MYLHKEGTRTIFIAFIFWVLVFALARIFVTETIWLQASLIMAATILVGMVAFFFRVDERIPNSDPSHILSVADGKVVAIETIKDYEFFNGEEVIQLSVFMSPFNIHANWFPVSGKVLYQKHHNGKFRFAWNPKSSTENERSGIAIQAKNGKVLLVKQIAGAMARRVVTYSNKGDVVEQGKELGFIKFGSRIDLLLPKDVQIRVQLGEKVKATTTVLASW